MQNPLVDLSWIFTIIFVSIFMVIYLYGTRLQSYIWDRKAKAGLKQLKVLANQGKLLAQHTLLEIGVSKEDVKSTIKEFTNYFVIEPINVDPAGVLQRLEHVFDVRTTRYGEHIKKISPYATDEERDDAEAVLSGAVALNYVYRVVHHFYLLGKKTKSIYYTMQLEMQLPMILQMAKSYFEATRAFADGLPIGDGIGPLVVAQLARDFEATPPEPIAQHTITQEGLFEKRIVHLIRAKGPGSSVGKPGEAIKRVVELEKGKIARIITISSGLKLDTEETGHVIEGVGAAIGDPGPEKFKIEDAGKRHTIPIDAIIIKASLEDALAPMSLPLFKAVPKTINRIENTLLQRCQKGDVIIIAGIGNTIGIA